MTDGVFSAGPHDPTRAELHPATNLDASKVKAVANQTRHRGPRWLVRHRPAFDGRTEILHLSALPDTAWDAVTDAQFFASAPQLWLHLRPNQFALFLPADLHLPLVGEDLIHKVVVKVPLAAEWPARG